MKIYSVLIVLFLLMGCQKDKTETGQVNDSFSFFVGTYTDKKSEGIYKYSLQKDGKLERIGLVAKTKNPAFLAMSADKKFLVAVNEIEIEGVGAVESYLIKDDNLVLINRSSSGGAHPCYISVNESGFVLVTNWSGGNMGLLRLNKKGELSDLLDVETHTGSDVRENQQGPHAHSAWFHPNDNSIISVDLGTNELWFSQLDTERQKLIPSDPQKLKMNPGAGPRHMVIHPNGKWIYVLNEMECSVTLVLKSDGANYIKGVSVSTLPNDYTEPNTCADIHVSSDGKFLYASNRGHNSIAIFNVNDGDGSLNLVGLESCKGDGPRNLTLSPNEKYLIVGNRHSNSIVSFERDKTTGLLKYMDQIDAPTPACILF